MQKPVASRADLMARAPRLLPLSLIVASAVVLSACGAKKEQAATQVAVRVNASDVTVHQINFRLQQQPNLRPEQVEPATRQILEQLIDQELAIQKAQDLKLDKDPKVVQTMEAARREVLARAYLEQVIQGVAKPSEDAAVRYYDEHPELFSQRRIYTLEELALQVPSEKLEAAKERAQQVKAMADLAAWAKAEGIKYNGGAVSRPAEQIPLELLKRLEGMKDGKVEVLAEKPLLRVLRVAGSRSEPVSFERAKPAILQFLLNSSRRDMVDSNIKALRTAAKVEYQGKYAAMAASQPLLSSTRNADLSVNLSSASGVEVSLPNQGASSVQVSLPAQQAGTEIQVSLPSAASGVEVRLGDKAASAVDKDALKKGFGLK